MMRRRNPGTCTGCYRGCGVRDAFQIGVFSIFLLRVESESFSGEERLNENVARRSHRRNKRERKKEKNPERQKERGGERKGERLRESALKCCCVRSEGPFFSVKKKESEKRRKVAK